MDYLILPSMLSADMTCLGEEVCSVVHAGADMIHFDVMDNHYVPNLTFGPVICQKLHEKFPNIPLDVHLMVSPTDDLIVQFANAGAKRISIHPDATQHLDRSLQLIHIHGCQAGLALNPATPIECIQWCHHRLDFVLVMTVNPGFGGQTLIPEMIHKIKRIHQHYPQLPICVDGGVALNNITKLAQAGVTQFVAGSAIFNSTDYIKTLSEMRQALSA